MNKIKTVLDRDPVDSDYIQSKQDFDLVLDGARVAKTPIWKSSWFFGVVGTACIVMTISIISIDSTSLSNESDNKSSETTKETIQQPRSTLLAVNQDDNSEQESTNEEAQNPSESAVIKPQGLMPGTTSIESEGPIEAEKEPHENTEPSNEATKINYYGSMFPKIAGVYTGTISVNKLCSGVQIETDPDYAVVSFRVSYYDGAKEVEKDVRGSYFPAEICQSIGQSKSAELITLTKIKAEHRVSGKTVFLNSMNIEATPD